MVAWTRWPHGAQKGTLPFSRRACQPFLMGKAPQRPARSRDTPKIRRANSEAPLPRRGKQRRFRTLAAYPCPRRARMRHSTRRLLPPPPQPNRTAAHPPPAHGAGVRQPRAKGYWPAALPPPAQKTISLRIPSGKPASISPVTPSPKTRRRRQAPARGLAAVNTPHRPNRTAPQHTRPLLVGRVCVNPAPKALAAGTAGWPAALPPFVIFSSRHLPFSARFAMVYL